MRWAGVVPMRERTSLTVISAMTYFLGASRLLATQLGHFVSAAQGDQALHGGTQHVMGLLKAMVLYFRRNASRTALRDGMH